MSSAFERPKYVLLILQYAEANHIITGATMNEIVVFLAVIKSKVSDVSLLLLYSASSLMCHLLTSYGAINSVGRKFKENRTLLQLPLGSPISPTGTNLTFDPTAASHSTLPDKSTLSLRN